MVFRQESRQIETAQATSAQGSDVTSGKQKNIQIIALFHILASFSDTA
jgi:hypothetical protein